MKPKTELFDRLPLITPERLKDPQAVHEIFSKANRPDWVKGIESPYPDTDHQPEQPALSEFIVLLGEAHRQQFFFTAIALATGYELCRPGHSWGTNDDHSEARNVYAQMIMADAYQANLAVARLFANAGSGQIVKLVGRRYDLTADNLKLVPGPSKREARAIAVEHAERRTRERPECLPSGVTVRDYFRNLELLFAYHDELADSGEG